MCYYYGPKQAVYEELGHAEVVQMELRGESGQTKRQMEAFADTYFGQFRKTPMGMMRLDPMDAGPAYRNVIGIPGGTSSPLFNVLKVCTPRQTCDSLLLCIPIVHPGLHCNSLCVRVLEHLACLVT